MIGGNRKWSTKGHFGFGIMGRKAQLGTAVAIAVDADGDGRRSERGCVVQTTEQYVVLRVGENSLRVVDAQAFCGGSIHVRHDLELPESVTLARKSSSTKYGLAWVNKQEIEAGLPSAIYVVDFQTGEVTANSLPTLNEHIAGAFVDESGEQLVVVGGDTGKLYGWSRCDVGDSDVLESWGESQLRVIDDTAINTQPADACSCGRFISSAVLGSCFVYLRASHHFNGSVAVEKWIFDVDARWTPVSFSSRALGASTFDSGHEDEMRIFMTAMWKHAVLAVGNVLYHIQVDQDLRNSSVKQISLDQQILDGAWIEQDTAFAMLLLNGQISIACINGTGRFELLSIFTSNTMSKRLSLSALLGKAVSAASQLTWMAQRKQVVVDFGTSCATFNLEIADDDSSASLTGNTSIEAISIFASDIGMKRVVASLDKNAADLGDCISELLDDKSSPSSSELLDIARIALARSRESFEDIYFMLLCFVHQHLVDDPVKDSKSRDPIDCIGNIFKIMEMLVSLTVSVEAILIRQVGSRIISALSRCSTRSDRKVYYRKEIAALSQYVQNSLSGFIESEDWWAKSTEVAAFLRVYLTTTRVLLQEIHANAERSLSDASQVNLLCLRIIEQEDGLTSVEALTNDKKSNSSPFERLKLLLLSYTMTCCCLRVNGIMIDLEHLFSITMPPTTLTRKEMLCCFLKPWLCLVDDVHPERGNSSSGMVQAAVKCAVKVNALQFVMNYSMASTSLLSHCFMQALCKSAATCTKTTENKTASDGVLRVDNLHWQACEVYIGEAMAILQRIGACRRFKYSNRENDCSTGRVNLSSAIGQQFNAYQQALSTELAKAPEYYGIDSKKIPLWEFSHLDERQCARVVCLVCRTVWHLEAVSENFGCLSEHAFGMNLLGAQLESSSPDTLRDCITQVRAMFGPLETELRLPRFQKPDDSHGNLTIRSQKIARSLVLIAWALWAREKAAYCSRSMHIGKGETNADYANEKETLGALGATCALQLNTLSTIYGANDELHSIQLSLLEEAATMNSNKTALVTAWGFPAERILTRYLKRYKGLRQLLHQSSSLAEYEQYSQVLQKGIKQGFYSAQINHNLSKEMKSSEGNDNDILVGCCCDPEVLQIMSVLTKLPFEAVKTTSSPKRIDQDDINSDEYQLEISALHDEADLPSSVDSGSASAAAVQQILEPQNQSESLISRDEVIALLQAQTRHLEEKIQAVTLDKNGRIEPSKAHETIQESRSKDVTPILDHQNTAEKLVEDEDTVADVSDMQRMARIALQVHDLRRHRYSSAGLEADTNNDQPAKPAKRHDSVRNALKLFHLRREKGTHPRSVQVDSNAVDDAGVYRASGTASLASATKAECDKQAPVAISSRRDKLKRADIKLKPSRNRRSSQSERLLQKEPVYPLWLEYGTDRASLKLLGRSSEQRNPSVKKRQFVHQERGRLQQNSYPADPKATTSRVEDTEVIQLKTTSAQTNDTIEAALPPASPVKEMSSQHNEINPEKSSPVTQESEDDKLVARCSVVVSTYDSRKGVGVQCRVTDDGSANEMRRQRGPPHLSFADKFPIWVDLDGADNVKARHRYKDRKKFLQVVRFGDPDATDHNANNDGIEDPQFFMAAPSVSTIIVPRKLNMEDDSDENQSDGQHSPSFDTSQTHENTAEQIDDTVKARYRASYHQHYPVREKASKISEDRDAANGIDALIDLRDNMQRMTQRLRVLETCANSIDEEFKVSQKRLSRIGERRSDGDSSSTRVLEEINDMLNVTEGTGGQTESGGVLSKKASNDLDAAKKLLGTIEQLTISANDQ